MAATSSLLQRAAAGTGCLSRSTTLVMGAVSGHHTFCLKGYSQTKSIRTGHFMSLGTFDVGGHSWSLKYYPNGSSYVYSDYISFFLSRDRDLSNFGKPAGFKLTVYSQDGKPVSSFSETSKTRAFNEEPFGYHRFMKREDFEKSACLVDDSFTIRCDVFVAAEEPTKDDTEGHPDSPPAIVVPPRSDLQKDLADLLWNKQGTDVTVDVAGETFHAHQLLLAARSSEFKERFFGCTKKLNHLEIDDMEPEVFNSMLHFIYTDTLPEMDEETMLRMAEGLVVTADRYKLEGLKTTCEAVLCRRIDLGTVEKSLVLAEKHGCPALKARCMEFLSSPGNLKALMASDGLEMVKKNCPTVLLDLIMKQMA